MDDAMGGVSVSFASRVADGSIDLAFAVAGPRLGSERVAELARALKPGGSLWIAAEDCNAAEAKIDATRAGLTLRNWVVWYRPAKPTPKRRKLDGFVETHSHLLYLVKGSGFAFDADAIRVPSARMALGDKRADPRGRVPDDTWILAGSSPRPDRILERVVRACSTPEALVLDVSASGVMSDVAGRMGRRAIRLFGG